MCSELVSAGSVSINEIRLELGRRSLALTVLKYVALLFYPEAEHMKVAKK